MYQSCLRSTGSYLPDKVLTNDDLSQMVDTTDSWIFERTGIKQRHIAAEGELTSDLALKAARDALEKGNIAPEELDLIIVATSTPDYTFPSTAVLLQEKLGANCPAFDMQAVCAGFIYGLTTAHAYIQSGLYQRILLVGAETFSRLLDWGDRQTCVLFGDGAGAIVLERHDDNMKQQGTILATNLKANGELHHILKTTGGPSATQTVGTVLMDGPTLFKHAVKALGSTLKETLQQVGLEEKDLDWLIPHQANIRIIASTAKHFKLPMERVIQTIKQHANTSAASIPLALDWAVSEKKFKRGELLALEAIGAGLTWGCVLVRW